MSIFGLSDTYKKQYEYAMGKQAGLQQQRESANKQLSAAEQQAKAQMAGTGAAIGGAAGAAAGATYGAAAGPIGALAGAAIGLLAAELF